jgi:hypothetical protein
MIRKNVLGFWRGIPKIFMATILPRDIVMIKETIMILAIYISFFLS